MLAVEIAVEELAAEDPNRASPSFSQTHAYHHHSTKLQILHLTYLFKIKHMLT
jgi:hypothetical protein